MSLRSKLLWMGLLTFVVFPLPAIATLRFLEGKSYSEILQLDHFRLAPILEGLLVGAIVGFIIYRITRLDVFNDIPLKVEEMIQQAHLKHIDILFLSLSAGFGEEVLFRVGVQSYLGIVPTSIIFVAIHGYFSIRNPKMSLYGLLVLPFILILGYGYVPLGLWFCISAHFSYDLLLFMIILQKKETDVF